MPFSEFGRAILEWKRRKQKRQDSPSAISRIIRINLKYMEKNLKHINPEIEEWCKWKQQVSTSFHLRKALGTERTESNLSVPSGFYRTWAHGLMCTSMGSLMGFDSSEYHLLSTCFSINTGPIATKEGSSLHFIFTLIFSLKSCKDSIVNLRSTRFWSDLIKLVII